MNRIPLILLPLVMSGCSTLFNQHAQTMDAMRGVMADTAARLSTSGAGHIAAGAEVINPGIRVSAGVEYYAVARYEGLAGQVHAGMSGHLDRPVSPELEARADAIWRDTALTTREKLDRLLTLFRPFAGGLAEHVPVSTQPGEQGNPSVPQHPTEPRPVSP